jgi:hypothetical protein
VLLVVPRWFPHTVSRFASVDGQDFEKSLGCDDVANTPTPPHPITAKMAKKRKAGGRAYGEPKAPKEEDSKLAINTWEDVADSEDEFHINRDKVLLDEGPAAKKLRKWQEECDYLSGDKEERNG